MLQSSGCRLALAAMLLAVLSACATPEVTSGINDPYEVTNRKIHERSRNMDRKVLRPAAFAYGENVPEPVRIGVNNFADNLGLPGDVVNNLLQLRIEDALQNTVRFMFNSTIGLGGVLDPGTKVGLTARSTDFGETLHVWGVPEGAYMVLPLVGPATERDAVGKGVDILLNPLRYVLGTPERYAQPVAGGMGRLNDRYRYSETIDSVLHESADSYAQTRLIYLDSRRSQLLRGKEAGNAELYDIYDETFE